jgi:hypothetical protein
VSYQPTSNVLVRVERGLTLQWPYFLVLVWLPALYMVLRPSGLATPAPLGKVERGRETEGVPGAPP